MQRRIVFAVLGVLLALVVGLVSPIFFSLLGIISTYAIALLLFPAIGYAWGKRRDLASKTGMPARYAYSILGFPLALLTAGSVTILITAVLTSQSSGPYYGSLGPGFVCVLLITPVAMLIFPLIGYVWGRRKDQAA